MQGPMTATKLLEQRDLMRQRNAEMADNRAALPKPPHYAGPNPHSTPPLWMKPILDMLLTGEGWTRL